jgi:leucyl aminopeptidase
MAPDPAVVFTPHFPESAPMPYAAWRFAGRPLSQDATVKEVLAEASVDKLRQTVAHLVTYNNRYYLSETGRASILWYAQQFKDIAAAARRDDVEVVLQEHRPITDPRAQPTLIVRIKGQGPLASERIIVGTPGDCINSTTGMRTINDPCPGADDNASGMAVVLESYRVLIAKGIKPARTLEFMAYAGEELGLIGAHYVAESYKVHNVDVAAVLQLEGTMGPGIDPKIALVSDYTHKDVSEFLGRIIQKHLDVPFVMSACNYGCSDHAAWRIRNFPVGFPFSEIIGNDNPRAHTPNDTIDTVSFVHGMRFTRITLAFLIELGLAP